MAEMKSLTLAGTTYDSFPATVDATLAVEGAAADAKAVGDALAEVESAIPSVPSTLPNPNKLTFTGAVSAEYDGSAAVSVEIPEGGGGSEKEWEIIWEKTFSESDLGTARWDFTPSHSCTEIVVIAAGLLSNQTMGFSIKVNDVNIITNVPYMTAEGIANRQVYCEYKGDVWRCMSALYTFDALGLVNKTETGKDFGVSCGKLPTPGKATTITFGQSAIQDYQVYGGSVRIYAR